MTLEEQVKERILALEDALLNELPEMPMILATIHKNLNQQPQLVQSLSDEDIRTVTTGLSTYTNTQIVTKKATKRKPSLKNVSAIDLC